MVQLAGEEIVGDLVVCEADPMRPFEVGEIVYLNSGSPPLTIEMLQEGDGGLVSVAWIFGPGIQREAFHPKCLTRFRPDLSTGK